MLAIRLTRTGKIHDPHYRIVVQEKRSKLDGQAIDIIGHYHPAQANKELVIDKAKAEKWLKDGAQPSDTVTNLFVKEGILDKSKKVHHFFTPTKKETPAEVVAEENAETLSEVETIIEGEEVDAEPETASEQA